MKKIIVGFAFFILMTVCVQAEGLTPREILNISKELGISTDNFQSLIFLGKKTGVSKEDVITMLRNLKQSQTTLFHVQNLTR